MAKTTQNCHLLGPAALHSPDAIHSNPGSSRVEQYATCHGNSEDRRDRRDRVLDVRDGYRDCHTSWLLDANGHSRNRAIFTCTRIVWSWCEINRSVTETAHVGVSACSCVGFVLVWSSKPASHHAGHLSEYHHHILAAGSVVATQEQKGVRHLFPGMGIVLSTAEAIQGQAGWSKPALYLGTSAAAYFSLPLSVTSTGVLLMWDLAGILNPLSQEIDSVFSE